MFASAEFWVAVAFFLFFGVLSYYGVPRKVLSSLDDRGKRIAAELNEAQRLRDEAATLLASYERKRAEAEREAADIVAAAQSEAERLTQEAQEKMADFIRRRTATAEQRIAQAEAQATAEVRAAAVDAAVLASERVIRDELRGEKGEALLLKDIGSVRAKLNA